jgi:hypothetical protein
MKVTGNFPGSPCWTQLGTSDPGEARRFYGGLFGWIDLATRDLQAALRFYPDVFGWQTWPDDMYPMVGLADTMFGGTMEMGELYPGDTPSHWNPYFVVADVDATAATARELGGEVLHGPEDAPSENGPRLALLRDPQGGVFGAFKPAARP